jgi:hypothetical protein
MKRFLVLALAAGLLAGCASRAAPGPAAGKPKPSPARSSGVAVQSTVSLVPIGTATVGHAHRVNVRNLPSRYPRRQLNCSGSAVARNSIRITPSPASSKIRICVPLGGTLTLASPAGAYHWSRPSLTGDRGVLRATAPAAASAAVTYRATSRGVAELTATGSPPAGSLGAVFLWTARVIVR